MTTRSIHTVVVAYHAEAELEQCLAALDADSAITVIDNSSSPAVRAVAERREVEYLDPGTNLGFGAGVNVALRHLVTGQPRDVLLLNPDAIISPHDIRALAHDLHRPGNERVGAVTPRILGDDGAHQRVEWPFPTPPGAWVEAVGLGSRSRAQPTFVIGAVLLLRWEAILEVGLFDERFFLYAEEADWQRRALALGWTAAVSPDAVARHQGAGTSRDPERRETLFHAAQETYIRKWYGSVGWQVYRIASCLGAVGRSLILAGERRSDAARRARLYLHGPRRCALLLRD